VEARTPSSSDGLIVERQPMYVLNGMPVVARSRRACGACQVDGFQDRMPEITIYLRLSAFIGDPCGCEVIPRCDARTMEQPVWGRGAQRKADTDDAGDRDGRYDQ
jgi:hypothetical protein